MINLNDYKNKMIAHRGIHNNEDIPENSISAFKKARDLNYPIELDIQLTKDNELVVFHDYNLERMAGINFELKNFSLDALKELKLLNTKEEIPTLKEVLNLINGKNLIDIEVKPTKKIKETCNLLLEILNNYNGDIIISSFSPKVIRYLKKNSNYCCGLLVRKKAENKLFDLLYKTALPEMYAKVDFIAVSKKILKNKIIQKLSKKYPTLVWTIKSKEEMNDENYIYICDNLPY